MTGPRTLGTHGKDPNVNSEWRKDARCKGQPTDIFYPEPTNGVQRLIVTSKAWELPRAVCDLCPVKAECLEWALATELVGLDRQGMKGGLTPSERHQEQKRRGININTVFLDKYFGCGHSKSEHNSVVTVSGSSICRICRDLASDARARIEEYSDRERKTRGRKPASEELKKTTQTRKKKQ